MLARAETEQLFTAIYCNYPYHKGSQHNSAKDEDHKKVRTRDEREIPYCLQHNEEVLNLHFLKQCKKLHTAILSILLLA